MTKVVKSLPFSEVNGEFRIFGIVATRRRDSSLWLGHQWFEALSCADYILLFVCCVILLLPTCTYFKSNPFIFLRSTFLYFFPVFVDTSRSLETHTLLRDSSSAETNCVRCVLSVFVLSPVELVRLVLLFTV